MCQPHPGQEGVILEQEGVILGQEGVILDRKVLAEVESRAGGGRT